jgi:hypothetical protein
MKSAPSIRELLYVAACERAADTSLQPDADECMNRRRRDQLVEVVHFVVDWIDFFVVGLTDRAQAAKRFSTSATTSASGEAVDESLEISADTDSAMSPPLLGLDGQARGENITFLHGPPVGRQASFMVDPLRQR